MRKKPNASALLALLSHYQPLSATIACRKTRGIFACEGVLERHYDTKQPLVDQVFALVPDVHQFYSDDLSRPVHLSTYHQLVYRKAKRIARHDVAPGKEQTYTVEGTNADLRCYVPPLARPCHLWHGAGTRANSLFSASPGKIARSVSAFTADMR